MARARNIKPGFFKNEVLAEQPIFVRLLFVGLWTLADREGRIEDRPKRIKLELFPYDSESVEDGLVALTAAGFVTRYAASGKSVIQIVNFLKHQTPHGTEKDSELPDESGALTVHERGSSGYVTGSKRANNVNSQANNVSPPLDNSATTVNPLLDNTLNPESRILIPDSLNPDKGEDAPAAPPPPAKPKIAKPEGVDDQTWADWLQLRKTKKAPVTQTVINGAISEANKAGMPLEDFLQIWCRRGSQGLEASWIKESEKPARQQPVSFRQSDAEAGWARWEEMTGRTHPDRVQSTGQVIDITPKFQEIAR